MSIQDKGVNTGMGDIAPIPAEGTPTVTKGKVTKEMIESQVMAFIDLIQTTGGKAVEIKDKIVSATEGVAEKVKAGILNMANPTLQPVDSEALEAGINAAITDNVHDRPLTDSEKLAADIMTGLQNLKDEGKHASNRVNAMFDAAQGGEKFDAATTPRSKINSFMGGLILAALQEVYAKFTEMLTELQKLKSDFNLEFKNLSLEMSKSIAKLELDKASNTIKSLISQCFTSVAGAIVEGGGAIFSGGSAMMEAATRAAGTMINSVGQSGARAVEMHYNKFLDYAITLAKGFLEAVGKVFQYLNFQDEAQRITSALDTLDNIQRTLRSSASWKSSG